MTLTYSSLSLLYICMFIGRIQWIDNFIKVLQLRSLVKDDEKLSYRKKSTACVT